MGNFREPRPFKPRVLSKTVAASGTPEALGASTVRMSGMEFIAEKAVGTANTGSVTIQVIDTSTGVLTDAKVLAASDVWSWPMPTWEAGYYRASDFTIKVATNGDGVRVIYSDIQ